MLRAAAGTEAFVQRLRARLARTVAELAATRTAGRRRDWYSAQTLWPDMFAGGSDGK